MVQANLRLVILQARRFAGRDLDMLELIQEGNLGLLRAVERFDRPISEDGEVTLGEVIRDVDGEDPTAQIVENDAVKQVRAALHGPVERERTILLLRFGLNGEPPRTLEKIGERLGLTRERIRQVQNRALAKLRHPSRASRLAGLFDVATRYRPSEDPRRPQDEADGRPPVPTGD